MKAFNLFSAAIIVWLFSFHSFAEDSIPPQLKQNIQAALDHYLLKDSISIDPQLGEELVEDYYQGFIDLNPKDFKEEKKAKDLIQYYATPEGIEGLFRDWMTRSDTLDNVLPIRYFLFANIYVSFEKPEQENTQNPEPLVKPEPPKNPTPSSQSTTVEPTGRNSTMRERVSDRQFTVSQHPAMDQRITSRNESAVVNSEGSRISTETAMRAKYNVDEAVIKKVPNKMLIARTMKFEAKRNLAISQLQDSVKLLPANSQAGHTLYQLSTSTPNKYAILIINEPAKPTANIYLNGKLMGALLKIKNGIRVHSNQQYNYEIKQVNAVYCSDTITLAPREKRITKCNAR